MRHRLRRETIAVACRPFTYLRPFSRAFRGEPGCVDLALRNLLPTTQDEGVFA